MFSKQTVKTEIKTETLENQHVDMRVFDSYCPIKSEKIYIKEEPKIGNENSSDTFSANQIYLQAKVESDETGEQEETIPEKVFNGAVVKEEPNSATNESSTSPHSRHQSDCTPISDTKDHFQQENPEEVEMLKCDQCHYKIIRKNRLKLHFLQHKNSQVNIFTCEQCEFQPIFRYSLKMHLTLHANPMKFKRCKRYRCNFQSLHKPLLHANLTEVKSFKCDECTYETIHKFNLKRHLSRHKKTEDAI